MAKKWTIREGEPLKVRVVGMTEGDGNHDRVVNRTPRVRILSRIAKVLVALWVMSIGAWLHSGDRSHHMASNSDGQHDAIDGHDPFRGL